MELQGVLRRLSLAGALTLLSQHVQDLVEARVAARPSCAVVVWPLSAREIVCTAAAARGLDFPRLRHVLLFDMPKDVAGFVHSAGRTARRGKEGLVTCLVESGAEVRWADLREGRLRPNHNLSRVALSCGTGWSLPPAARAPTCTCA